ncbi:RNA polymerase sigma-54 factor [Alphaproteobacteria bacterium]|nr:RNA polymerase sigma-54 factor [Alphaproteobacteria bacterium]
MALSQKLDLRQTQSLIMTPQLQQAIKLLQLNNVELSSFIDLELEKNPLLERDESANAPVQPENSPSDNSPINRDLTPLVDSAPGREQEAPLDSDYENNWGDDPLAKGDGAPELSAQRDPGEMSEGWGTSRGGRLNFDDDELSLERSLARAETLREHLIRQLNVDVANVQDRLIGRYLIELVDEAGYLRIDRRDIAETLGCSLATLEDVLFRLQSFHPPGVCAGSLAECLALQLKDKDRFDPAMEMLLAHLDLLGKRDLATLMRLCGVDAGDMADMIAEIRALDPKPGLAFEHDVIQILTPDVLMRPDSGEGWIIELNPDTLPRLLVNVRYYAKIGSAARGKDEKTYLSECYQSANWLVKALHQRATTIMKVATEIVRQQDAFFRKGVQFLRPLVLRDIAEAIAMHESTVSRVTNHKYMATPRGIYELKYFFTQAIADSGGGEAHSAEAVRHKIRSLIEVEKPDAVLSDDSIVEILRESGIDIARRTVAKYREVMRIPSSVQRRREKKSGG